MGRWSWNESLWSGLRQAWHHVFFVSLENKDLLITKFVNTDSKDEMRGPVSGAGRLALRTLKKRKSRALSIIGCGSVEIVLRGFFSKRLTSRGLLRTAICRRTSSPRYP
jgi:hypothetical protein